MVIFHFFMIKNKKYCSLNEIFLISFYYFEKITSEFFKPFERLSMLEKIIGENEENNNLFPYNKKVHLFYYFKTFLFFFF